MGAAHRVVRHRAPDGRRGNLYRHLPVHRAACHHRPLCRGRQLRRLEFALGGGQRRSLRDWRPGHDHRDDAVDFLLHAVVYQGNQPRCQRRAAGRHRAGQMQRSRLSIRPTLLPAGKEHAVRNKPADVLRPASSFNVTPGFASRRLAVGARVTVEIIRPNWIGEYYRFTMRARRGPGVQIARLAPGGSVPGAGC